MRRSRLSLFHLFGSLQTARFLRRQHVFLGVQFEAMILSSMNVNVLSKRRQIFSLSYVGFIISRQRYYCCAIVEYQRLTNCSARALLHWCLMRHVSMTQTFLVVFRRSLVVSLITSRNDKPPRLLFYNKILLRCLQYAFRASVLP